MDKKKVLAIFTILVLIINIILLTLGLTNWIIFWIVLGSSFFFLKAIQRMR